MKYVIVGGAGAMGKISAVDFLYTASKSDEIVIADYNLHKAQQIVRELGTSRVKLKAAQIDVRNPKKAAEVLKGAFAVINASPYHMNLLVMEAALLAQSHYIDLGGLFHMTLKQLELHKEFKKINRLALLGMGAAPGITNLLSCMGADMMDSVSEIHTRVASVDHTRYEPKPALEVSYSLKTILEEFSFKPAVFTKGKLKFVDPMSGRAAHAFPKPIGKCYPMYTIHSEVATLPESYKHKGVKEVSFKIAFDDEFSDRVRFLRDIGLSSEKPIHVGDTQVKPIDVINAIAMNQPPVKVVGKVKQHEVVRAVVKGLIKGKPQTIVLDCHTQGIPEWGLGLDSDTGCPPVVAAQMLAAKEIIETGVLPPEKAIDPKLFFKHLKKRKMTLQIAQKAGHTLQT